MSEKKIVHLGFRVPASVRRQFRALASDWEMSQDDFFLVIWDEWTSMSAGAILPDSKEKHENKSAAS